jgi:hypothetical protein
MPHSRMRAGHPKAALRMHESLFTLTHIRAAQVLPAVLTVRPPPLDGLQMQALQPTQLQGHQDELVGAQEQHATPLVTLARYGCMSSLHFLR